LGAPIERLLDLRSSVLSYRQIATGLPVLAGSRRRPNHR
jgi:hypothetical protein